MTTISLILESHNLQTGRQDEQERAMLRVLEHLRPQLDAMPMKFEVLLTQTTSDAPDRARYEEALGRPLQFVALPRDADYYHAKNAGFDASIGEIVVFADSDCWPEQAWLAALVGPLLDGAQVAAGRTRYRDDVLGKAVSLLDFLYVTREMPEGHTTTRNFYANNVAFRREVFAAHRYRHEQAFFRGHCQMLGMELHEAKIPVVFVDEAVTVHRFPDRSAELIELRLRRGGDLRKLAPQLAAHAGISLGATAATGVTWLARQAIAHRELRRTEPARLRRAHIEGVALAVASIDALGIVLRGGESARGELGYLTDHDRLG